MITSDIEQFAKTLEKGPILAIDYGKRKLGIAVSDPSQRFSTPLLNIESTDYNYQLSKIQELAKRYGAVAFVIGLPISLDGTDNAQSAVIRKLAQQLNTNTQLPIFLQDERFSSKAADYMLSDLGLKRRARNKMDDSLAASIILERFLNSLSALG